MNHQNKLDDAAAEVFDMLSGMIKTYAAMIDWQPQEVIGVLEDNFSEALPRPMSLPVFTGSDTVREVVGFANEVIETYNGLINPNNKYGAIVDDRTREALAEVMRYFQAKPGEPTNVSDILTYVMGVGFTLAKSGDVK